MAFGGLSGIDFSRRAKPVEAQDEIRERRGERARPEPGAPARQAAPEAVPAHRPRHVERREPRPEIDVPEFGVDDDMEKER